MTPASESLRKMDEAMTDAPWLYDDKMLTRWPGIHTEKGTVLSIGHDYYRPDPRGLVALRNALPELIAVVRAAEYVAAGRPGKVSLRESLAALHDALNTGAERGSAERTE